MVDMMNTMERLCTLIALGLLFFSGSAMAATPISTITTGNTVFLGEQGLDITSAMGGDTSIGWWASGASITTSSPDKTIVVSDPGNFFISPTDFGTPYLGNWFHVNPSGKANGVAFIVADPRLDMRIEDATLSYDATNNWVPTDDEIQFRIDTNLYQISQRPGVSSVPITIKVQSPDGGMFSALVNKAGITTQIDGIAVTGTPFSTGPIWDTGKRDTYPPGTYTIWAECNVNSMKDNYGQIGKTMSGQSTLLDQDKNPLIHVNAKTPVITMAPTTKLIVTPTTIVSTIKMTPVMAVPTRTAQTAELTTPVTPVTTTQKKSLGFDSAIAGIALVFFIVLSVKKN